MKMYSLLLILLFTGLVNAQESFEENVQDVESIEEVEINWFTDFKTAKAAAKKQKKPMLVYFTGSDWCKPCVKLKKDFFNTPQFAEASEDYIVVMLDIPYRDDIISLEQKKINKEMQKKLRVSKFPTLLALDHNGRERNRMERYSFPDPQYYWEFMNNNERLFGL
ncbi:thioredoxin disulfide isomerase [Nonlabens ulvanivorans]|uniref:Thioredoxin disulfide isomerase n=1 Tax=Nonlabens ulvanivorans TaxID=906888 RepID=A0A090QHG7_NONUL|nr:thioredoxin family protein [Nonlabens ulvanivorans]WOI21503.1 thioredoxin family protein [Nonlabens ulvanivorans]GAL01698.1 thioredoxin disulfide isomerase [Nonlabens ulvanivorans]